MTNRRDFLVKFTLAGGAVAFLQPLNVFANFGITSNPCKSSVLTILHTANLKGQGAALDIHEKMFGLGGLENIARKIKGIKKESSSVLVIDAGNMIGTDGASRERNLKFYKRLSEVGYDAVIPGDSDLAQGSTYFSDIKNESGLSSICTDNSESFNTSLPYTLVKKGSAKIGIINASTSTLKRYGTISVHATAGMMSRTAQMLRDTRNCSLVLCIVQASDKRCSKIASLSSSVDVILSAHEVASIHNTRIIRDNSGNEVIISYAGTKGVMMSRIDLTFNDKGEKINFASNAVFTGAVDDRSLADLRKYNLLMG